MRAWLHCVSDHSPASDEKDTANEHPAIHLSVGENNTLGRDTSTIRELLDCAQVVSRKQRT